MPGAGGSGSTSTTQGNDGGTSFLGTLKVGGGGGGNGGGARPTSPATYTNEIYGGLAGAYSAAGISFLGFTYTGIQGVAGSNPSDGSSGGMGGVITPSSVRTSTISGTSTEYSKISAYRPWEDVLSTSGTKTYGSGGSPNYGYGTDPSATGGAGASGVVIIRYTLIPTISTPTYVGPILKGTPESVTVTVNLSGVARFYIDGKRIPGCLSVTPTGTAPNLVVVCTWEPSVSGVKTIYVTLTPSDGTSGLLTSEKVRLSIIRRSNTR